MSQTCNKRRFPALFSRKHGSLWLVLAMLAAAILLMNGACGGGSSNSSSSGSGSGGGTTTSTDPPAEEALGERLFIETRFAEYFAVNMTGINQPLAQGDPVVAKVETMNGTLPGPYAGQSINCRSCHFVVEFTGVQNAGNRSYADFTDRSPLPRVINNFDHTPRNAVQMVGSMHTRSGATFLHFDGEFNNAVDLVEATMTGRNFGWSPDQQQQAIAHIARVIREDNGTGQLAVSRSGGMSYATLLLGTDSAIPSQYVLPASYRLDVAHASDQQILDAVANLILAYMSVLQYQEVSGIFVGSPFDVFLRANGLPGRPSGLQTAAQFNQQLLQQLEALVNPVFVTSSMGSFKYHSQPFVFGQTELAGLKIFLSQAPGATDGSRSAGNCVACHQLPNFTDELFHATGVAQEEYDAANGDGAFMALAIPGLAERNANYDQYLPMTLNHPTASERFRHAAVAGNPQFADLGLWNVYLNPDMPKPQSDLAKVVCASGQDCSVDQGLANTIAQFKTPDIRDLEDSSPYFHNGSKLTVEDVVRFYVAHSQMARQGTLRNAPPEFGAMSISQADVQALTAFLNSLTEDYDDQHAGKAPYQ